MRRVPQALAIAFLFAMLAMVLYGCPVFEQQKVDMCVGLGVGEAVVVNVRPNDTGIIGYHGYTFPWVSQHTLMAKRSEDTTLVCVAAKGAACSAVQLEHLCTIENENPATSDLMQMLSSPFSTLANHVVVGP